MSRLNKFISLTLHGQPNTSMDIKDHILFTSRDRILICTYVNEGRPFWQYIAAWHLCDSDAEKVFKALRAAGAKLAVVSNFDTQLRPVLRALNCDHWFDAVAVSAEIAVLPTMLDLLFTEATKHKDGGPLDKESSNTIEILQIGRADILSGDIILPAQRRWVYMIQ
ncbi:hypothetical protein P3L10_026225 [Capsicum annuum]